MSPTKPTPWVPICLSFTVSKESRGHPSLAEWQLTWWPLGGWRGQGRSPAGRGGRERRGRPHGASQCSSWGSAATSQEITENQRDCRWGQLGVSYFLKSLLTRTCWHIYLRLFSSHVYGRYFRLFEGTGSRDGLVFCWYGWVELGLNKKKSIVFLAVMRTPLFLTRLFAFIWSKSSFLSLVRAAVPCFPLTGEICEFYADIFDYWPILHCFLI